MEMRAREDLVMAQDLIPSLPPTAAALHDCFLSSHCSSCFRSVRLSNYQTTPPLLISCSACSSSLLYCSPLCRQSDSLLHSSSGECRLLRLLLTQSSSATWHDTSDIRAALRLLSSFETLGCSRRRIGWLSSANLDAVLGEDGSGSESEMAERIRIGAELMRRVRRKEGAKEEEVLWAVLTNAVEVQVSEGPPLGIAVYGPWFSWFNHSCSPNSCYRFELAVAAALDSCDSGLVGVWPESEEEAPEVWKTWLPDGINLTQGMCQYGPRIVVRSIKPIKKGEEVCITYSDLVQPKAVRHFDLWSKYRFICSCKRCSASPEMYIDYILNSDGRSLSSNHNNYSNAQCHDLADLLDQAVAEYMSDGNPEECYKKLTNMLSETFQEPSKMTFRLHPLHYLSLNAYITLSSTCRILSNNYLATGTIKGFRMGRASVAYSLLLAGATHHLFMSEPSFIASTSVFLVNAGRSIFGFLRSFCEAKFSILLHSSHFNKEVSYVSLDECKETTIRFLKCTSRNLIKSWPYLVQGLSHLENIRSPVDFSWLGIANTCQHIDDQRSATDFCACYESKIIVETHIEEYKSLAQLAVCCLTYGRYLAVICWGLRCYLVDEVLDIFRLIG